MSRQTILGIALILFLVGVPLVSYGTAGDNAALWWVGLALLIIAGLPPPLLRFLLPDDQDDGQEAREEA